MFEHVAVAWQRDTLSLGGSWTALTGSGGSKTPLRHHDASPLGNFRASFFPNTPRALRGQTQGPSAPQWDVGPMTAPVVDIAQNGRFSQVLVSWPGAVFRFHKHPPPPNTHPRITSNKEAESGRGQASRTSWPPLAGDHWSLSHPYKDARLGGHSNQYSEEMSSSAPPPYTPLQLRIYNWFGLAAADGCL